MPPPFDRDEIREDVKALYAELAADDLTALDAAIEQWRGKPTALLQILHFAQETFTWLPRGALERIARGLDLPSAEVYGYATFFDHFYLDGPAAHTVRVCKSISCFLRGSRELIAAAQEAIGLEPGERSGDGRFRFETVSCLGLCDQAPGASIDDVPVPNATPEEIQALIGKLKDT